MQGEESIDNNGHVNARTGGGNGHAPKNARIGLDAGPMATDRPLSKKLELLVPGSHPTSSGPKEVSEDTFADSVLDALPEHLLYRSGRTVGVLTGSRGTREFFPGDSRHFRLLAAEHTCLAKWIRTERGTRKVRVNHGRDLATLVMARAELSENVRRLDRIVHYPAYDRKFELLRPGWSDGTLYDPAPEIEGIVPETNHDFISMTLEELVVDFPFLAEPQASGGDDAGEANRQNLLGLMLTPIVRTAIDGNVPMHLVNSSMERTGKTKLVEEVVGGIILGVPMASLQQVGDGSEFDKRVTGLLRQAETLVHLDNVNNEINFGQLASVLTSTWYQGRILGSNDMPRFLNTLIWVVSGNNVEGSSEIVKRVVPIHLQPKDANPEDRPLNDFVHPDLRRYVQGARPKVLSVLLGMVENWKSSGRPKCQHAMGGFDEWSAVVGGILKVNGYTRWMTNAKTWRKSADSRGGDLESLVEAWATTFYDRPVKPRHLIWLAAQKELLDDMRRASRDGGLNKLGRLLKKSVNRPVGKYRITLSSSGNNSVYALVGAERPPIGSLDADEIVKRSGSEEQHHYF